MKAYSSVNERFPQTGLFLGFVSGFPGAHSQGETLDELNHNLQEVITMLLEDGAPELESEFMGVQNIAALSTSSRGVCLPRSGKFSGKNRSGNVFNVYIAGFN